MKIVCFSQLGAKMLFFFLRIASSDMWERRRQKSKLKEPFGWSTVGQKEEKATLGCIDVR